MGLFGRKDAVPEPAPETPVELWEPSTASNAETEVVIVAAPEPEPTWPQGPYRGRLVTDGLGNLLADDGPWAGYGVFHNIDEGHYEFVEPGGLSHNQRHHHRVVGISPTTSGNAELEIQADPHHERPTDDDAHFASDGGSWHPKRGWSFTRTRSQPDEVAPFLTGHTDAYVGRQS